MPSPQHKETSFVRAGGLLMQPLVMKVIKATALAIQSNKQLGGGLSIKDKKTKNSAH